MAEKESEKVKKRTGKLISSFVVLTIVLSVLAVSAAIISADDYPPPPEPTSITVTAEPTSIPADGTAESNLTARAMDDSTPSSGFILKFKIIGGPDDAELIPDPDGGAYSETEVWDITDENGYAYATLRAGTTAGTVEVNVYRGDVYGTITVTLTPEYGVELTVDQAERTTAPDVNAIYTLTVRNIGTLTDSYTLSVDNVNSADVADLSTGSITDLGAGETEDVSLIVRDAGEWTYVVNVTVEGSEGVSDMVTTKTIVIPDAEAPVVTNPNANPATILNDNGRPRPSGTNISRLNVTVTDEGSGVSTITINLSPIGGSPTQGMTNIGGDVWSVETSATAGINETHNLVVNATDNLGYSNTSVSIPLTVLRRGDIVRDNIVDDGDLMYLAKYIVGREPAPDQLVADVWPADSWDGVDDADLMYIAKYIVGKESEP